MDRVLCPEMAIAISRKPQRHSGSSRRFGESREGALRRTHAGPPSCLLAWSTSLILPSFLPGGSDGFESSSPVVATHGQSGWVTRVVSSHVRKTIIVISTHHQRSRFGRLGVRTREVQSDGDDR